MTFSLFEVSIIVIICQGLFLCLGLQLIPNKNKGANRLLSVILFIATIMSAGRILVYKYNSMTIVRIGTILDATIYLFGPLLYTYFRRLLFKDKSVFHLPWYHYLIIGFFSIYAIWTFTLDAEGLRNSYETGTLKILYFIIELTGLCSMTFYTLALYQLMRTYKSKEASFISYNQNVIDYLTWVLVSLSIFILIWIFSFISSYGFEYYHPLLNYNAMWLSVSIFMFFIGYYSLTQPQIFRIPFQASIKIQQKQRISEVDISIIKTKLDAAIITHKLYLLPDLSLASLANSIETTSNNLSWYLNKNERKTFYEYINQFRIDAFVKKVEEEEYRNKTILAMALDSGFNSKSTFNKSFKQLVGETPGSFIKKQKEISSKVYN
ncbi:MAG: AraC family transcriptional regulator [Bacteroidota bacterium]